MAESAAPYNVNARSAESATPQLLSSRRAKQAPHPTTHSETEAETWRHLFTHIATGSSLHTAIQSALRRGALHPNVTRLLAHLGVGHASLQSAARMRRPSVIAALMRPLPLFDAFLLVGPPPAAVARLLGARGAHPIPPVPPEVLVSHAAPSAAPLPLSEAGALLPYCFPSLSERAGAPGLRRSLLRLHVSPDGSLAVSAVEVAAALGRHLLRRGPCSHVFVVDAQAGGAYVSGGGKTTAPSSAATSASGLTYACCVTVFDVVVDELAAWSPSAAQTELEAAAASAPPPALAPAAKAAPRMLPSHLGPGVPVALSGGTPRTPQRVRNAAGTPTSESAADSMLRFFGGAMETAPPAYVPPAPLAAAAAAPPHAPPTAVPILLVPRVFCLTSRQPFFPLLHHVLRAAVSEWRGAVLERTTTHVAAYLRRVEKVAAAAAAAHAAAAAAVAVSAAMAAMDAAAAATPAPALAFSAVAATTSQTPSTVESSPHAGAAGASPVAAAATPLPLSPAVGGAPFSIGGTASTPVPPTPTTPSSPSTSAVTPTPGAGGGRRSGWRTFAPLTISDATNVRAPDGLEVQGQGQGQQLGQHGLGHGPGQHLLQHSHLHPLPPPSPLALALNVATAGMKRGINQMRAIARTPVAAGAPSSSSPSHAQARPHPLMLSPRRTLALSEATAGLAGALLPAGVTPLLRVALQQRAPRVGEEVWLPPRPSPVRPPPLAAPK